MTDPPAGLDCVLPRYGVASLADVLPSLLAALGVPGSPDPLGLGTGGDHDPGPLAGVNRIAVVLIDGLGWHQLPLAAPCAPALADLAEGRLDGSTPMAITAGFPSTTPTSLVTLGTGSPPGDHGILGLTLLDPDTDRLVEHLRWGHDPDPRRWQPVSTQFDRAAAAGVITSAVTRPAYQGSGLTAAATRGARFVAAADPDALAEGVLAALRAGRGPALVYGYHPDVDRQGHDFGVDSPEWRVAVSAVDRLVARLVDGLPPNSALVLTADHGQLNVPASHRFDLDADPRLRAGVRVVAGEARVRYLHTEAGATDDVIATWRGILGDAAVVVPRAHMVSEGWFGPVPPAHLRRIGDVVVMCQGTYVVTATATESPSAASLVAYHGGSTAVEMMIPLLVVRR